MTAKQLSFKVNIGRLSEQELNRYPLRSTLVDFQTTYQLKCYQLRSTWVAFQKITGPRAVGKY